MITDNKGQKWSNQQLLEKVFMLETEIEKVKACHLEAEKELLAAENLCDKLRERMANLESDRDAMAKDNARLREEAEIKEGDSNEDASN